jgi:hypothetical protein
MNFNQALARFAGREIPPRGGDARGLHHSLFAMRAIQSA